MTYGIRPQNVLKSRNAWLEAERRGRGWMGVALYLSRVTSTPMTVSHDATERTGSDGAKRGGVVLFAKINGNWLIGGF